MKKVSKILALLGLALMLLISAIGCEIDEGNVTKGTADTSGQAQTSQPTAEGNSAKVGEFLSNKKWKVTLQGAKQFDKITGDNEFVVDTPADGKVFLVLLFEVENISSEDDYFNYFYFKNYVDEYSTDLKIIFNDVDGCGSLSGNVAAGKKLKGCLAFEVSPEWKVLETSYQELSGDALKFRVTPDQLSK